MPPTFGGAAAQPPGPSPEPSDRFAARARALFYARLVVLAISLAVLAVPSWSLFLGTTSPLGFGVYFAVITYSVANFLLLEHPTLGKPVTYVTLVLDLVAVGLLIVPSGGLKSPIMAAHVMLTLFFVLLFPRLPALIPPFLFLPVVARLDLVFQEDALISQGLFLVLWYTTLSLITAYVILYLNARDERSSEQLSALSKAQEDAIITEERLRLAREMHDGLGGHLSSLIMQLEFIQRATREDPKLQPEVTELKDIAEEAMEELRRSLTMMRRDFDLHETLEDYCLRLVERTKGEVQADFKVRGRIRRLPSEMQLAIFRLLQECLNNIQKHARASRVKARLRYDADLVSLTVADDGVGFEPAAQAEPGHYGLTNMEERAKKFRGTLEVQSAPGKGTTIHATLVIPAEGSHVAFLPDGM
jgi:signal transduction histidine kinase